MIISTPGRICLFGEHQDYLGLPVIAAAISLRVQINGVPREDDRVVINMPDIDDREEFSINETFPYTKERDYFRSTIHVLKKRGLNFSHGFDVEITGNIPINSGTSSSSALIVTWANFLARHADSPIEFSAKDLAEIANEAEVLEFGEPGGMMDHYSTAIGNVIYLESQPAIHVEALFPQMGTFVLGDSMQPKDTIGILARCRFGMEEIIKKVTDRDPDFSIHTTPFRKVNDYSYFLTVDELGILKANIDDRDILLEGKKLLSEPVTNQEEFDKKFGKLLYRHYLNLRDHKKTSTPKIERMMRAAMRAGALGGKINGSGGGGCMFVYAPQNAEEIAAAIESEGGRSFIITIGNGTALTEA
jgi:galactokinase